MTGPFDPLDTHVPQDGFWAAYAALQTAGVGFAEVRAETANRVAVAVLAQRTQHGLDRLRQLGESVDTRRTLVDALKAGTPKMFTSVTRRALDVAVEAAAKTLSE